MCVCLCAHMRPQAAVRECGVFGSTYTHRRDNRFAAAQNDLLNIYEALRRHGFYLLALGRNYLLGLFIPRLTACKSVRPSPPPFSTIIHGAACARSINNKQANFTVH